MQQQLNHWLIMTWPLHTSANSQCTDQQLQTFEYTLFLDTLRLWRNIYVPQWKIKCYAIVQLLNCACLTSYEQTVYNFEMHWSHSKHFNCNQILGHVTDQICMAFIDSFYPVNRLNRTFELFSKVISKESQVTILVTTPQIINTDLTYNFV